MIRAWVDFWDTKERPTTLAVIRILMPLVLLADLGQAWLLDVHVMWAPAQEGGWSVTAQGADDQPLLAQWFGGSTATAMTLYWVTCLLCLMLSTGTFSRTSALLLVLAYAQLEDFLPVADRAIDRLYRNLFLVLAFSGAGRTLSVDAWLKTRSWWGDGELVGGWARRLFILQVVWMYFDAGIEKGASGWTAMGGYEALHIILQDPIMARMDFTNQHVVVHWLTRVGTAGTVWWEMLSPLVLVVLFAHGEGRLGRLGNWLRARHFREVFLAVGLFFHVMLWLTLELGMFPPAMMVLYPCFYAPELVERWLGRGASVAA